MPFYRCGGGSKVKLITVDVTSAEFPELFKYIDERNAIYTIATSDKKIISVSFEIVNRNAYSASSISFYDATGSENKLKVTSPTATATNTIFNGLKIGMYSTLTDGDLHFNKLSYTYIQT